MGWVLRSKRELNRVEVFSQVPQGRMTATTAANVLGFGCRQGHRLLKTFQADGPAAIRHNARGRASNNRIDPAVRNYAVTLVRQNNINFGPTFAAEKLGEDHGLAVSHETMRKRMIEDGLWLPRRERRKFHRPRLRRECYGELSQLLRRVGAVPGATLSPGGVLFRQTHRVPLGQSGRKVRPWSDPIRPCLERAEHRTGPAARRVVFPDGQLEIRWKGMSLRYSAFDKDQGGDACDHHRAQMPGRRIGIHQS